MRLTAWRCTIALSFLLLSALAGIAAGQPTLVANQWSQILALTRTTGPTGVAFNGATAIHETAAGTNLDPDQSSISSQYFEPMPNKLGACKGVVVVLVKGSACTRA